MSRPEQTQENPLPSFFGRKWNLICVYGCFLWVAFAILVFWGTLDNIDFDGATKETFQPYESLIGVIVLAGIVAMSVGFVLGLLGCFAKPFQRRVYFAIPTAFLFLLLALLAGSQIKFYGFSNSGTSATVEDVEK